MKKVLSIVAIALMTLASAFAQENNNRDAEGNIVRGPYLTNKAGDNWFINIGGGINTIMAKETKFSIGGPAVNVNVGKWFTPTVGARFGYLGFDNSFDLKNGYTTLIDNNNGNFKFFHYVHGDLLWHLSNTFSGYKETRFWDVIAYTSAGWVGLKDPYYKTRNGYDEVNDEWGVGAGFINDFRLSDRVGLFVDLSVLSIRHEVLEINPHQPVSKNNIFAWMPTALVGLTFNLGRTNWDRVKDCPPTASFTDAEYKALQNSLKALEAKNKNLLDELEAAKNIKPETVVITTEGKKQIVLFYDIAKNTLNTNELAHLKAFASKLSPDAKLTVIGSADSGTGNETINTKLAITRANGVVDILVKEYGLSRENIEVKNMFDLFGNNPQSRATLVE